MESNKQQIEEVGIKIQPENRETRATPKQVWIRPMHIAPSSLSRDKRIKMKKSIHEKICQIIDNYGFSLSKLGSGDESGECYGPVRTATSYETA